MSCDVAKLEDAKAVSSYFDFESDDFESTG